MGGPGGSVGRVARVHDGGGRSHRIHVGKGHAAHSISSHFEFAASPPRIESAISTDHQPPNRTVQLFVQSEIVIHGQKLGPQPKGLNGNSLDGVEF